MFTDFVPQSSAPDKHSIKHPWTTQIWTNKQTNTIVYCWFRRRIWFHMLSLFQNRKIAWVRRILNAAYECACIFMQTSSLYALQCCIYIDISTVAQLLFVFFFAKDLFAAKVKVYESIRYLCYSCWNCASPTMDHV